MGIKTLAGKHIAGAKSISCSHLEIQNPSWKQGDYSGPPMEKVVCTLRWRGTHQAMFDEVKVNGAKIEGDFTLEVDDWEDDDKYFFLDRSDENHKGYDDNGTLNIQL